MRPRVFPAEDISTVKVHPVADYASMRPRVFPAEDRMTPAHRGSSCVASMRPRVFPAEDAVQLGLRHQRVGDRFNEAAGIPRGRHVDAIALKQSTVALQ